MVKMITTNSKTRFVLISRWFLIPLLLYLIGQYLEGSPYRVIVRSLPFLVACFALSWLATDFLRSKHKVPLWTSLFQGGVLPVVFIFSVQGYYSGAENSIYASSAVFLGLLMVGNGGIYVLSLFSRGGTQKKVKKIVKRYLLVAYKVRLYSLDHEGRTGAVRFEYCGKKFATPLQWINLDGFSQNQAIDLSDYWATILQNQLTDFQTDLTVRESIVKFGEVRQLVDHYQLVIQSQFMVEP